VNGSWPYFNLEAIISQLLDIASRLESNCVVPCDYLEPLLIMLDPGFDAPIPLVHTAICLIAELVQEPHYLEFFARPHPVELVWGWYLISDVKLPQTLPLIECLRKKRPAMLKVLLENSLMDELEEIIENPSDLGLELIGFCLEIEPGLFPPEMIAALLTQAHFHLFHSEDPNLPDSCFQIILQIIRQFPDVLPSLADNIPHYAMPTEDDCISEKILRIFTEVSDILKVLRRCCYHSLWAFKEKFATTFSVG
jgi:hypothetical protein